MPKCELLPDSRRAVGSARRPRLGPSFSLAAWKRLPPRRRPQPRRQPWVASAPPAIAAASIPACPPLLAAPCQGAADGCRATTAA